MTNTIDVTAQPVIGGYMALYRRVHRAAYDVVRENGKPKLFPTEDKAKLAAWEALKPHLLSIMHSDGDKLRDLYEAANARFKLNRRSRR